MQNNQTNFGALWNGSPQYATKNQLLSTSQGLETEISSIVASGAVNTWANFPAINNVNMAGFSLSNAANLSTMNLNVSSINGATINVGGIVINNSTITNGGTTINGGNITNNNTTTSDTTKSKTYTVSDVVTSAGAAIDSITDSVEALSGVFTAAEGAAQIASVAYGVGTIASGVQAANGVVDLATKGASLFTTRTANTISGQGVPGQTTAVYETVNGTTQFQFSTLNVATTTVFRTTDRPNPNQKFGNESFLSTIIPAGSLCVRSVSDPLQFQMISTQLISTNNYLQSYGQWTRIFEPNNSLTADTATISVLSTARTYISSINDSIRISSSNLSNVGQFQANNGIFNNAISVTNNAQVGSLTSLGAVSGTSGSFSGNVGANNLTATSAVNGATAVFSGSIQGGSLYTPNNTLTGTLTVTGAAGVGSLTVTGAAGVNSLTVTGTASAATVNATTTNTTGVTTSAAVSTNNLSTAVAFISSINGINVDALGGSTTTLPFLSTGSISTGTITAGAISTNAISTGTIVADAISTTSISTAVSFISSINGVSFASLVNPVPTETVSTFQQLFTSSFQANNISSGLAYIMQFNASSIQALDISTSTGYINQLNTSSIRGTNLSTGVGFINQLFASSIQAQNISTAELLTGTFSASTINAPLNFSLISTVANQGDIPGVNTTLLKSFISLTSPIPLLNLTNQGGVPQVFNDSNFSYWNQCAFQAPTGSPDVYAATLSVLVVNTTGQVDFYVGSAFTVQINYPGGSTLIGSFSSGFPGSVRFTFAAGAWTFTNTFSGGAVTNSNNLQLSQNVSEVLLQTTDSLVISTALLDIRAPTNFQTLIAQQFNASTISTINTYSGYVQANLINGTTANISTITNANLFGSNAFATNINGATIICSTLTTSNIQNADAILVQKFQGNTPLAFNSLTNQYVTLSGGLAGTNARAQTNQINFLALPGMVDSGIPNGFPAGTTLTFTPAGLTLLNGNPGFPSLWFSSITSVDNSLTSKIVNFQIPTGGNGEVVMLTNGINNVQVQSNGTNFGIITTIGYSKLSWNAGVFTTQNVGTFSPYPSTMVTQDTRIHTGANNAMNLINKQTLFNGDAPIIFFQNFTGFFTGSPVGRATGSGVLSYNGSNFATNQWSCYLSFYNINLAQNNLAINNFNVTAQAIGSNWGAYCYTGIATVAGGATTGVNWNVQCMMVPKEFSLIQNFNKFGEEPPEQNLPPSTFTSTVATFSRLELPEVLVSSMTASTIALEVSQNMSLLAGIPIPAYLGTGNILLAGTASVEIAGDQAVIGGLTDVDIEAVTGDVTVTAASTISLTAPRITAGTAVIGTPSGYGTNYAYFGNNSLAANGGEYALLQENNGRTFLNSKLYQPLNLRNGNYDIMILDDTQIQAFKPLNMNSNDITNVRTLEALSTQQITITQTAGSDFVLFNNGDARMNAKRDAYVGGDRDVFLLAQANMNMRAPASQYITIQQTGSANDSLIQFRPDGVLDLSSRTNMEIRAPSSNYITIQQQGAGVQSYLQFDPNGTIVCQTRDNLFLKCLSTNYITLEQQGSSNNSYFQLRPGGEVVLNTRTYFETIATSGIYLTSPFTELRGYLTFNTSNNYLNNVRHIYGDIGAGGGGLAIDYMYGLFFNSPGRNANLYIDSGNLNMINYNSGINIANYNSNGTGGIAIYSASNFVNVGTGTGYDINLNGGRYVSVNAAQPGGAFGIYASTINATSLVATNVTIGQDLNITATGSAQLRASYFNFFNDCYFNNRNLHDMQNIYFGFGAYISRNSPGGYSNAFLDIIGAGGDGQLRLINGSAEVALRANSDLGITPTSGYSIVLNGTTVANYNINMNSNSITNVSTISMTSNATIISPDTINLTAPSTFMTGSLYFNPASTSEIDLRDGYIRNASYITNPYTTNIQAFTGLYLTSDVRANITAPNVRIQGDVDHVNCNVSFISQLRSVSTINNNIDVVNLNIDAPSTIISGTVQRNLSGTNVTQPVIQYDTVATSGNSGSVVVNLPVAYTSGTSYVAFVSMEDADPAETSVVRVSSASIEIYWQQAGGGSHTMAWQTIGT